MRNKLYSPRLFFPAFLLACLLTGLVGAPSMPVDVKAAPMMQTPAVPGPGDIVISEFRFLGPQGGNDEFIELFNPKNVSFDISNFEIWGSNNSGSIGTNPRIKLSSGVTIPAGGYYLLVNSGASTTLLNLKDATYNTGITDDGGVALRNDSNTVTIDAVGLSTGSAYKEGTPLTPLSGTAEQSYERKFFGETRNCNDSNNNVADFVWNTSSSNPQNSSSNPVPCLYVTNVTSTTADNTYTSPTAINITVDFTGPVYVAGAPTIQLETGITNNYATYQSGSSTSSLTFVYNAAAGDFTTDLDYVSSTALSGSIYDIVGNANLTLPTPGSVGSLGANKNIQINIVDNLNPTVVSIKRRTPLASLTNAPSSLVFRVTFSELVTGVGIADFVIHPNAAAPTTTASITNVTPDTSTGVPASYSASYDVTVSGGDFSTFSGNVGLDISLSTDIVDQSNKTLTIAEPSATNDETYLVDHSRPTVTVNQAGGQADPTGTTPIIFTVAFSESIVVSTFTTSDITYSGSVTWSIANPLNDRKNFVLTATAITQKNLDVRPSISAGLVEDDAGNTSVASTSTDNSVTFSDTTSPTLTIKRASGQATTTTTLPIRFAVSFSEPIATSTFTPGDITSSGTATGISWTITDSGDHKNFTINATAITGPGTIIPFLSVNRVTDIAGNLNLASTPNTVDGTVTYGLPTPTPTRTPTKTPGPSPTRTPARKPTFTVVPPQPLVAINEFVPRPGHDWNNDGKVNTDDEYIELINHGVIDVNLSSYKLDDEVNIGSVPFNLPSVTLKPGQRMVFYGSDTGLLLSDGGDGVRLLKSNGQLVDAFNYTTVIYPDQAFCRLPDDGGADDWNDSCYPTPGLRNSLGSFGTVNSTPVSDLLCPFADTAPADFVSAECDPFGNNIWRRAYWDATGWLNGLELQKVDSKWEVFAD